MERSLSIGRGNLFRRLSPGLIAQRGRSLRVQMPPKRKDHGLGKAQGRERKYILIFKPLRRRKSGEGGSQRRRSFREEGTDGVKGSKAGGRVWVRLTAPLGANCVVI